MVTLYKGDKTCTANIGQVPLMEADGWSKTKPAPKAAAKPVAKPVEKPAEKPAVKPVAKPASSTESSGGSKTESGGS